jgi:hypothetical protein
LDTLVDQVEGEFVYVEGSHVTAQLDLVHVVDARHFEVFLLVNFVYFVIYVFVCSGNVN